MIYSFIGNAFTILDDDKELKTFKHIINSIESIKVKMLPIAITKPILEYADNELADLNLTIESEISPIQETGNNITKVNGNNVIEENLTKDSESKTIFLNNEYALKFIFIFFFLR